MKAFEEMWEGDPTAEYQEKESIQDKITDLIFRMEEAAVGMYTEEMSTNRAEFQQAPRGIQSLGDGNIAAQQEAAIASSHQGAGKPEPVRNKGPKVGRNDPCPCGSGKKYKQCCMKKER
jgi:preprotein translocase subunit SecA